MDSPIPTGWRSTYLVVTWMETRHIVRDRTEEGVFVDGRDVRQVRVREVGGEMPFAGLCVHRGEYPRGVSLFHEAHGVVVAALVVRLR